MSLKLPRNLLAVILLATLAGVAHAQTYRWVDKDGSVHYSDQPPPPEIKKLERKSLGDNVVDTADLPYETKRAAENFPVTLYSSEDCGDTCALARNYLKARKIPYVETRLKTQQDVDAFKKATGADNGYVPTLLVGRQSAKGYQESSWNNMLEAAGYPR